MIKKKRCIKLTKIRILGTFLLLTMLFFGTSTTIFADGSEVSQPNEVQPRQNTAENIVAYDNRERILRIVEISFVPDFTAIHVLVQNSVTRATFTVEHQLNVEDTTSEYIEITAGDGMGNLSAAVQISNPFFAPEEVEEIFEEPPPIIGELTIVGTNPANQNEQNLENQPSNQTEYPKDETLNNTEIPQTSQLSTEESHDVQEVQEIQAGGVNITINTGQQQMEEIDNTNEQQLGQVGNFTGVGWVDTVEHASTQTHEFFLLHTATGNPFYLILDRSSGHHNVHFLNPVSEWDLLELIQTQEIPDNTGANVEYHSILYPPPEPGPTPEPTPTPTPELVELVNTQPQQNNGIVIILFLIVMAVVGAFLHMKGIITIPFLGRKSDKDSASEFEKDEEEDDDESEEIEETEDDDVGEYDETWDKFDDEETAKKEEISETPTEEMAESSAETSDEIEENLISSEPLEADNVEEFDSDNSEEDFETDDEENPDIEENDDDKF